MFRYSIATLGFVVLCFSIYCAALSQPLGIWPQVAVTLTVAILLFYTLAAMCWRMRFRPFTFGLAVTGWIYFLLVFVNWIGIRHSLLMQAALDWAHVRIHAPTTRTVTYAHQRPDFETRIINGKPVRVARYVTEKFQRELPVGSGAYCRHR